MGTHAEDGTYGLALALARCGGHGCTPMVRHWLSEDGRWPDGTGDSERDRDAYLALLDAASRGDLIVRAPERDAEHGLDLGPGYCPDCEWYGEHEEEDGSWAGMEFELTEADHGIVPA